MKTPNWILAVLAVAVMAPAALGAQIDYRNLDDDRPTLIEDAYPVERHAFEFLASWRLSRERRGGSLHAFTPELEYGFMSNAQLGVKLPIVSVPGLTGREWSLAGLRLFALYNFNTESRRLPALSIRGDASMPVGSQAGEGTRFSVKGIATRSWGASRIHLNGAYTFGHDQPIAATDAANKWWAGGALDRTLYRNSMLLIGEVYAMRPVATEAVQVNASIGMRYQLTPYAVLDAGIARRLRRETGPDYEITIGYSRSFAVAGLMPVGRGR